MTLASINSQISRMESSVTSLKNQVGWKQEEVARLNRAIDNIEGLQDDYEESRRYWQDTELTADTWKGELADAFHAFRNGELNASFRDVSQAEVQRVLAALEQARGFLVSEIDSCQMQIAAKQSTLNQLYTERRRELQA